MSNSKAKPAVTKPEVDAELEAIRAQYPPDAVVRRSIHNPATIKVQLKAQSAKGMEYSGVQNATPGMAEQNRRMAAIRGDMIPAGQVTDG